MLTNILKPYSAILFLNNKYGGFIIFLITFINPSVAISGAISILSTVLFAKLLNIADEHLSQGFYIYNSLLVGMGIGFIFMPSLISTVLIAVMSVFTFMLSFMLNRVFGHYNIPILSLPFSIVTIFIYLASLKYATLMTSLVNQTAIYDIDLPIVASAFFKSLGAIFFLPNTLVGILLLLLMVYFSRIISFLAVLGFYFGVLFHSFLIGSFDQALANPYAFNYILTSIALGGVFLLPTINNFLLSLIGVAISVVLTDAMMMLFNYYMIPVFALPFNLTVIIFIFILSSIYYKGFNYTIKTTPEKSLSHYLSTVFRFGKVPTKISLPFVGTWSVYQGFDDEWTHQGEYKYAYDFIKLKERKSFQNEGLYCSDYYCFGESIIAPVSGNVVDFRDDLVDNSIGEVDRVNNWGNYIIIKSEHGFFVNVCHLMQHSVNCKVGEYIHVGSVIAKCGNSGYSPLPHIHIQAQYLGVVGGFTKPFCFKEFYLEDELLFNTIPEKGSEISSVIVDKSISARLNFILDECYVYDVYEEERFKETVQFEIKMDSYGEFYFKDEDANQLYFYSDDTQFYFYNYLGKDSYLKYLYRLAPKFPFVNKNHILFKDYLQIGIVHSRLKRLSVELFSILNPNYSKIERTYRCNNNRIISEEGYVELALFNKNFQTIKYQDTILKRCDKTIRNKEEI